MTIRVAEIGRRSLRGLIARHVDPAVTDRDLLRQFTEQKDEAAFETLVRRHGSTPISAEPNSVTN